MMKAVQLEFNNESFDDVVTKLKKKISIVKSFDKIKILDKVNLKECGKNNIDNFQIFTPGFIVNDMINAIGRENISNSKNTILEPSSGDGAFTCRILELRFKDNVDNLLDNILNGVLECISTLYSVEMDKELIEEQRNNIYTIAVKYLNNRKIILSETEDYVLKFVIYSNFIWGMTNIKDALTPIVCSDAVFKMPEAEKNNFIPLEFPVWGFSKNKLSLHYEDIKIGG